MIGNLGQGLEPLHPMHDVVVLEEKIALPALNPVALQGEDQVDSELFAVATLADEEHRGRDPVE